MNFLTESKARVYSLGTGLTAVAPAASVPVKPSHGQMTLQITVAGGSARSVQAEISFDGVTYVAVGTARTTTGTFVELIPAAPRVRLNITANTGSTIGGELYA